MTLFERRHLGRQEENIEESGVQIRTTEPLAPVEDQVWLNTSQNRLKIRKGGNTVVLLEGTIGAALEIPPDRILDAVKSRSFFKVVSGPYSIAGITNFTEGQSVDVLISNTNPNVKEVTEVTVGSPVDIPINSYMLLNSASDLAKFFVWLDYDGLGVEPIVADRTGIRVLSSAGLKERTKLTMPSGGITSGNHFLLSDANNNTDFYVWYNTGDGFDPILAGKVGIQVLVNPNDTAAEYAEKTSSALDALPNFTSSWNGSEVILENAAIGVSTAVANVSVAGLVIERLQIGKNADTPLQLATKMASAINSSEHFDVPVPVSNKITITNSDFGFTENASNYNMGSSVTVETTVQGSGRVVVGFPANVILPEGTDSTVFGMSSRLFKLYRVANNVLAVDRGTFVL